MALTQCRECGKQISDAAKVCPHCGVPKPVKPKPASKSGCLFLLAIGIAIALLTSINGGDKSSSVSVTPTLHPADLVATQTAKAYGDPSVEQPVVRADSKLKVKPEATLGSSTNGSNNIPSVGDNAKIIMGPVAVAQTKADFDEFTKLAVANDEIGGNQMINSGRVFVVEAGTSVKVIETGLLAYRIRVTSGSHAGKDGWVIREAVGK